MAKVFLTTGATNYVVANTSDSVFGSTGTESISIASNATAVTVDSNTETVMLIGAISTYTFKQTGNVLSVYSSGTLVSAMAIDDDGSTLIMNSVSYAVAISGGAMTLGGTTVSTTVGAIVPAVSGTAAALAASSAALVTAVDNPTVTITGTTAATVAELKAINNATNGAITLNVETIAANLSGVVADIKAAFAGTITTHTGTVTLSDASVSVTDANIVDAGTSGAITATITEGAINTLATLTGTGNAYTVTVTDTGATAAELNTLDDKTTVNVIASAVTTIESSLVADVKTLITNKTTAGVDNDWTVTLSDTSVSVTDYNTVDAGTSGVITAAVAATGGADTFVLNNNILAIGTGTAFLNGTDQLSFVGMTGNGGTLAELDITNDGTNTDGATLDATNSTVYCIDTDATDLNAGGTTNTIADFTVMANVAAFLTEGVVTAGVTGKVDYFVINDGSDNTKAYIYKFVDEGDTVLNADGTGLTLIGSVTHDATATAATSITIA